MASAKNPRDINLAVVQQRDPYIVEIVDTASQVALYSFNSSTNEWVRNFVLVWQPFLPVDLDLDVFSGEG